MEGENSFDVTLSELNKSVLDILKECHMTNKHATIPNEHPYEIIINLTAKIAILEAEIRSKDAVIQDKEDEIELLVHSNKLYKSSLDSVKSENVSLQSKVIQLESVVEKIEFRHSKLEALKESQTADIIIEGSSSQKETKACRQFRRHGWCRFYGKCRYSHVSIKKGERDCFFWMNGFCRKSNSNCKFIHELSKKGSRKRNTKEDSVQHDSSKEESNPASGNNLSFLGKNLESYLTEKVQEVLTQILTKENQSLSPVPVVEKRLLRTKRKQREREGEGV